MNLFIDTSNWQLIFILEKNDQVIDYFHSKGLTKISDIAIEELKKFLSKNNLNIREIKNLYITKGPGSYTGVRVGLGIAKTLFTLDKNYDCFVIDSLKYQSGNINCISILDARGGKSYVGVLQNGKYIVEPTVVNAVELENMVETYKNFKIIKDYENIDIVNNFESLKNYFTKVTCPEDFDPLYIKSFI